MKQKHGSLFIGPNRIDLVSSKHFPMTQISSKKKRSFLLYPTLVEVVHSILNSVATDKSTSFSKYGQKCQINPLSSNTAATLVSTYYGKFAGRSIKNPKKSPCAAVAVSKPTLNVMHKTSTGWTQREVHDTPVENKDPLKATFGATQTRFMLPSIDSKNGKTWRDKFPAETNDPYIKSITSRKSPAANNNQAAEHSESTKIRTFNWEGIHFEISPKKPVPEGRNIDLLTEYSKEMNLMQYNFNHSNNNSINRNRSESPKPEPRELKKKNSMNYLLLKEKCETEANRTTSTTANTNNEDRIYPGAIKKVLEDDQNADDSLKNLKKVSKSPRTVFGQPNSVQIGGRVQSPPNLITKNSILLFYHHLYIVSKKLRSVIFQHKPLERIQKELYSDIYYDRVEGEGNWRKFRGKVLDLGSEIQEDIHELSSEDDQ